MKSRTIASMNLRTPEGKLYPYSYDFGYDYPEDSARFMFYEGNYSCDCNLSDFLHDAGYIEQGDWECGDTIKIEDFKVDYKVA